jgi:hypothetical protein
MRPRTLVFGIVSAVVGLSATVWLSRYGPWANQRPSAPHYLVSRLQEMKDGAARQAGASHAARDGASRRDPSVDERPAVADQEPLPRAVASDRVFEFGRMAIGERKTHRFRLKNEGPGSLTVARGPAECKCTISAVSVREIPPGGFADVELTWAPLEADPAFEKSAIIWTNDPKLSEIHFRIAGKVGRSLAVSPTTWHAGTVAEDHDGKAVGTIVSEIGKSFKILSVEPHDPNIKVSYKAMSEGALKRVGMLSGYEFTTTISNRIPIGSFRSRLSILTTLEPKTPVEVDLTAVRPGPIRILSAGNAHWDPEKMLLNLGRFRHEIGIKTVLPACIYDMRGQLRMLGVSSSDSFVKLSLEPSPGSGTDAPQYVRFVFEVLPGSPPVNYFTQKPVHVTVQTNHPTLKKIDFDLQFVSM